MESHLVSFGGPPIQPLWWPNSWWFTCVCGAYLLVIPWTMKNWRRPKQTYHASSVHVFPTGPVDHSGPQGAFGCSEAPRVYNLHTLPLATGASFLLSTGLPIDTTDVSGPPGCGPPGRGSPGGGPTGHLFNSRVSYWPCGPQWSASRWTITGLATYKQIMVTFWPWAPSS